MAKIGDFITPQEARIIMAPLMLLTAPELQVMIRGSLYFWALKEHNLTIEEAQNWTDEVIDEIVEYARALGRRRADQN